MQGAQSRCNVFSASRSATQSDHGVLKQLQLIYITPVRRESSITAVKPDCTSRGVFEVVKGRFQI